jgi:micrococcal nuclease
MSPRRLLPVLVLLVLSLLHPGPLLAQPTFNAIPDDVLEAELVRVIDGDTIEVLLDGEVDTVRLIGVDAPERESHCFAPEAHRELRRLIKPGRTIWLELDVSDRDRYGRILAYVWLIRGTQNPTVEFVNERLVQEGFAVAARYAPDVRYAELFAETMAKAEAEGAGFWSACGGDFRQVPRTGIAGGSGSGGDSGAGSSGSSGNGGGGAAPVPLVADCSPFGSYEEAQVYYAAHPEAQPIIDPNGDGRACEVWFDIDQPPPAAAPQPAAGSGCDPNYIPCIPAYPPDLNCPDIGFTVQVIGGDPHGLDRDKDGWGCE